MNKHLNAYVSGNITLNELFVYIFQEINSDNVSEVLNALPTDIREEIVNFAKSVEDPSKMLLFQASSVITKNRPYSCKNFKNKGYRKGIQAVKDWALT